MPTPEIGSGWEIIREFVDPEIATAAGNQVLSLIDSESTYISTYPTKSYGHFLLDIYRLHAWSPSQFPEHPNTLMNDSDLRASHAELLLIHRKACKTIKSDIPIGQINVFDVNGRTRRHRDRSQGETVVVNLKGEGRVNIIDPVSREPHQFIMHNGDAMHLINPRRQSLRPLHVVKNVSSDRRVTLVV